MTATLDIAGPFKVLTRPLVFQPGGPSPATDADRTGPVAWWTLDETDGTTATDATGRGWHGQVHGPPRWAPGQGARGGALEFDGARNWIECDPAWEIDTRDEFTVSGWFKIRGTDSGTQTVVAKGKAWWLRRDGARNTIEFGVEGPRTSVSSQGGSSSVVASGWIDDGHWHHVACVYDGRRLALYIDGREQSSQNASGPVALTTAPVTLGDNAMSRGEWFNGWMDDVRIYDRGLSAAEIQALYGERSK